MTHAITRIRVFSTYESCERTTFYVELLTGEGFEMTPSSHRTGSIYTNHEGLTIEEARDRALIDAADWGDFLGIEPDPFIVDDIVQVPSMLLRRYSNRRALKGR